MQWVVGGFGLSESLKGGCRWMGSTEMGLVKGFYSELDSGVGVFNCRKGGMRT